MTEQSHSEHSDTHECPAPGCTRRCPFERFACREHWFKIPAAIRNQLWREYSRAFGQDRYWEVRADCLRALGVPEDEIASANAGTV